MISKLNKTLVKDTNDTADWEELSTHPTVVSLSGDIDYYLTDTITISGAGDTPDPVAGDLCIINDNGTVQKAFERPYDVSNDAIVGESLYSGTSYIAPSGIIMYGTSDNGGHIRLYLISHENDVLTLRNTILLHDPTSAPSVPGAGVVYDSDKNRVVSFFINAGTTDPIYPSDALYTGYACRVGTPTMSAGDITTVDVEYSTVVSCLTPYTYFQYYRSLSSGAHYNSTHQKIMIYAGAGYSVSVPGFVLGTVTLSASPSADHFESLDIYQLPGGTNGDWVYNKKYDKYYHAGKTSTYIFSISGDSIVQDNLVTHDSISDVYTSMATDDNDRLVFFGEGDVYNEFYIWIGDISPSGTDVTWTQAARSPLDGRFRQWNHYLEYDRINDIYLVHSSGDTFEGETVTAMRFRITDDGEVIFGNPFLYGDGGYSYAEAWWFDDVGYIITASTAGYTLFFNYGDNITSNNFYGIYQGNNLMGRHGFMDSNQSGLVINTNYYMDEDGQLTTDADNGVGRQFQLVGKAVSDTEIIIKG